MLTMAQNNLLIEAIRRLDLFHPDKDPLEAWSGLGFRTDYRPVIAVNLMEWVDGAPAPRTMGWLRLTEKGLAEVNRIRKDHGEPMVFNGYHLCFPLKQKVV